MKKTIGERLIELKERSGLSLANIAKSGGFKGPSSVQRYFSPEYDPEHLPTSVTRRLVDALTGFGEPPIISQEVEELSEYGFLLHRKKSFLPDIKRADRKYIECVGSYEAAAAGHESLESWLVMGQEPLRYFVRPSHLSYRPIYAFFMEGIIALPRIRPGEIVFYETERPASNGADVVVFLSVSDGEARPFLVGTLAERGRAGIRLSIGGESDAIALPNVMIDEIAPILAAAELLEQTTRDAAYA